MCAIEDGLSVVLRQGTQRLFVLSHHGTDIRPEERALRTSLEETRMSGGVFRMEDLGCRTAI